ELGAVESPLRSRFEWAPPDQRRDRRRPRSLHVTQFRREQRVWRGCPRQESNLCTRFRKPLLYPLSYGGRFLPEQAFRSELAAPAAVTLAARQGPRGSQAEARAAA